MSRNTDKIAEYLATAAEPKTDKELADFIGHGMREKIHGAYMVEMHRPDGARWGIVDTPGTIGVKYGLLSRPMAKCDALSPAESKCRAEPAP